MFDIAEANGPGGVDLTALDQQLDGEGGSGWPFVSSVQSVSRGQGRQEEGDAFERERETDALLLRPSLCFFKADFSQDPSLSIDEMFNDLTAW